VFIGCDEAVVAAGVGSMRMELVCPGCGLNAAKILLGADNRCYAKCLECGMATHVEPPPSAPRQLAMERAPAPASFR